MKMTYLGNDTYGDRPVYEDENGKLWKDVDPISDREPRLCSAVNNAFDGEPDCPYHPEIYGKPEFIPYRVLWR